MILSSNVVRVDELLFILRGHHIADFLPVLIGFALLLVFRELNWFLIIDDFEDFMNFGNFVCGFLDVVKLGAELNLQLTIHHSEILEVFQSIHKVFGDDLGIVVSLNQNCSFSRLIKGSCTSAHSLDELTGSFGFKG